MNVGQHASALGRRPTAKPRNHLPYQIKWFADRKVIRHGMAILIYIGQNAMAFGSALESPAKYQNNLLVSRDVILNQMPM